jgi:hypothetical protein
MREEIAVGLDTLFEMAGEEATYKVGGVGSGTTVRIILSQPDDEVNIGRISARTGTTVGEVRISEAPNLAKNDTFTVGSDTWKVKGRDRDALRLIWTLDLQ